VAAHADDHGNEEDRVLEKVQFDARYNEMEDTYRNRLARRISM
jgi:hypothetical protein